MRKNKHSGFTLIEVLIALTFIAVVITAVTALIVSTLRTSSRNIHMFQATALAQEGLEVIRFMRDSNQLQNYAWDGGSPFWGNDLSAETSEKIIYLDQVACNPPSTICWEFSSEEEVIELSEQEFTRTVILRPVSNLEDDTLAEQILEVEVLIEWLERGNEESLSLSTYISNWQQ